jgi:hypothetical protein
MGSERATVTLRLLPALLLFPWLCATTAAQKGVDGGGHGPSGYKKAKAEYAKLR